MKPDETIEGIIDRLDDPVDFVRGIVGSFYEGFDRNEAVVRIGISGTGASPHYCIEQGKRTDKLEPYNLYITGFGYRTVFNGRSHKPILEDHPKGTRWSSATATFADVEKLLGSLRRRSL